MVRRLVMKMLLSGQSEMIVMRRRRRMLGRGPYVQQEKLQVRRQAPPGMSVGKGTDWAKEVSMEEVWMMVGVVMTEDSSRDHGMMRWEPQIRGHCWAAELQPDHLCEPLLREG